MNTAFITGITGQDGSYLTEFLLAKGYEVHGLVRRTSNTVRARLEPLVCNPDIYNKRLFLHYGDLDDPTTTRRILKRIEPDEFYHLAGQTHVGLSFEIPESTCELTAMGTLRILEIIRDLQKKPRFLHASSSEIFGKAEVSPQDESAPMNPVTPYGVAKAFATQMCRVYRETYQVFVCNAICYNHESPRRGESFVTRKVTRAAARIHLGLETRLHLGDLDSCRDWGYAGDYVHAMWRMLQASSPDDYVLATGVSHSVRELLEHAFGYVGLDWREYVVVDRSFYRPNTVNALVGDASKAKRELSWHPSVTFERMIETMVDHDVGLEANSQAETSTFLPEPRDNE